MLPTSESIDFTGFHSNKKYHRFTKKDVVSILNDAQRKWLDKQKEFIDQQISKFYPLTDEQWRHVTETVNEIIKKAKGHESEVRKELFDLIEKWDRKEKVERK